MDKIAEIHPWIGYQNDVIRIIALRVKEAEGYLNIYQKRKKNSNVINTYRIAVASTGSSGIQLLLNDLKFYEMVINKTNSEEEIHSVLKSMGYTIQIKQL
jgi:predicted nucleic acid-binding protein